MKKEKNEIGIGRFLLIMMLISSVFLTVNFKTLAASPELNGIDTSGNLKALPDVKPEYFSNGFPDRIYIGEEKEVTPETVIIDTIFTEGHWLDGDSDGYGSHNYSSLPGFIGYIGKDGRVISHLSQGPKVYVNKGEVAFSAIFRRDSPLIGDVKVINYSYWRKVVEDTTGPNDSTTIVKTEHFGVNNTEAYSLARTTGSSVTKGMNFGGTAKGLTVGGNFSVETSESLTRTFGRQISIDKSEETQIRHQFDKTPFPRRVAVYQYCEGFKTEIKMNNSYSLYRSAHRTFAEEIRMNFQADIATDTRLSEVRMNTFVGLEVKEEGPMTRSRSMNTPQSISTKATFINN